MNTEPQLPPDVQQQLHSFVESARLALGEDLVSIVLYGSAAEGRLRTTSDVNVLLVLRVFERRKIDALREPLRLANAAVALTAMFLLESEIEPAAEAFAMKFADIIGRHQVLHGPDPFSGKIISRQATLFRLKQTLLNLELRLRERYAMVSLREERLATVLGEAAGPLRVAAQTLLSLQGQQVPTPREALRALVSSLGQAHFSQIPNALSELRDTGVLPRGVASSLLFNLLALITQMRALAQSLPAASC